MGAQDVVGQQPACKRFEVDVVVVGAVGDRLLEGFHVVLEVFHLLVGQVVAVGIFEGELLVHGRGEILVFVPPVGIALEDVARLLVNVESAVGIALHAFYEHVDAPVFAVHDEVDVEVFGCPSQAHELAHLQAYHGVEGQVAIVDECPVLVVEAVVAPAEHVGLLLQFYLVAFLAVVVGAGVATNLDGDAADVFFIVARVEEHLFLLGQHGAAMHLVLVGGADAEGSWRWKDIVAGGLLLVDGVDVEGGEVEPHDGCGVDMRCIYGHPCDDVEEK